MDKKYVVLTTQEFEDDFKKLDNSLKERIKKELSQLEENPSKKSFIEGKLALTKLKNGGK